MLKEGNVRFEEVERLGTNCETALVHFLFSRKPQNALPWNSVERDIMYNPNCWFKVTFQTDLLGLFVWRNKYDFSGELEDLKTKGKLKKKKSCRESCTKAKATEKKDLKFGHVFYFGNITKRELERKVFFRFCCFESWNLNESKRRLLTVKSF